jgi:iron-sulfur cluster assembly protein
MITLTESAKEKALKLFSESNLDPTTSFIRVGVKGGGCSGLSYVLDFDSELKPGDQEFEDKGIKIVCDKKSLLYLLGTELDHSDGLNGKGFEFRNPNAERVCGCGESFSV